MRVRPTNGDPDAVVIGAGHNGLVAAAYLARAGLDVLVVEARHSVGGTAASERFAGATVNVCNCDHLTFRTTPVIEELDLTAHGLHYVDVDPTQHHRSWAGDGGTAWSAHRSLDATVHELGAVSAEVASDYRRYVERASPVIRLILDAANEPPTVASLSRAAVRHRLRGVATAMRWSRSSAADVLRSFFGRDELVAAPASVIGPMVWGVSPETPGTGLGALPMAMRHVAGVGRPAGGSGRLTDALRAALEANGGTIRTGTRVVAIRCDRDRVAGVTLDDGTDVDAPVVVSACNPHATFVRWLRSAPRDASALVDRWSAAPHHEGYESKIDLVLDREPSWRDDERSTGPTTVVAPSMAEIDRGAELLARGEVLPRPALLVNVPTQVDPTMAPAGRHVMSVEVLFTPYGLPGGWSSSSEPERWLDLVGELCQPGWRESIVEWRAMTPDRYESEFHLPAGHAASFAGGPLAALRNPNPELTRYQTAVEGLYLTGAATFPGAGVWGASGRNCAGVVLERV